MNQPFNIFKPELTGNGLYGLFEEQGKGIIVQILSAELLPERKPDANSLKYKYHISIEIFSFSKRVVISDGAAKHKAVLGNKAATIFKAAGIPSLSIIRVNEIMNVKAATPKKYVVFLIFD